MAQNRSERILDSVTRLTHEMLNLHGIDNMAELVLHALCHETCYNLPKAAYFVNNHDFDCLKGIAGYNHKDSFGGADDVCCNPAQFSEHMKSCMFNQKVRGVLIENVSNVDLQHLFDTISQSLGLMQPQIMRWKVKHENEGILLFEVPQSSESENDVDGTQVQKVFGALCLLGFCPVF